MVAASSASRTRPVELLHPAPERVPVEERRSARRRRDERTEGWRADDASDELVQHEREKAREEREVRLPRPGRIDVHEPRHAERQEAAERVAVAQPERQHRLVARRRQARDARPVRERVVEHPEPRGGVVQLHVAGERRLARRDDRRGVRGVCRGPGACRPRLESPAQACISDSESGDREGDHERHGELGRRIGHGREAHEDHRGREAGGRQQGQRKGTSRQCLECETASERHGQEHDREDDPGDDERRHQLLRADRRAGSAEGRSSCLRASDDAATSGAPDARRSSVAVDMRGFQSADPTGGAPGDRAVLRPMASCRRDRRAATVGAHGRGGVAVASPRPNQPEGAHT